MARSPDASPRVPSPPRGKIARMCAGVLKASYMRKWMSERLKRRKKTGDGSPKEASNAPEPLQPKYYDNEPAAAPEAAVVESRRPSEPEPAPAAEPASEPSAASAGVEPRPRTSRRRRGRGGRGGSRSRPVGATPAPAAEPSAVEPSAAEASAPEPVVAPQWPAGAASTQSAPVEATPVQAVPVQTAPVPPRASKGTVVLAIGLPGSGKSSWFKRHNIQKIAIFTQNNTWL